MTRGTTIYIMNKKLTNSIFEFIYARRAMWLLIAFMGASSTLFLIITTRNVWLDYNIIFIYLFVFALLIMAFDIRVNEVSKIQMSSIILIFLLLYPKLIHPGGYGFYTSSQILPILYNGSFDNDISFHLAIAEMIKNYGIPSTGIHGIPFLNYHWGSHYFLAMVGLLSGISLIELVSYQNTFFVSLVIAYFFNIKAQENRNYALAPLSILILFMLHRLEPFFDFFDISTTIAFLFGFMLLSRISMHKKENIWIEMALLFITVVSEISVGAFALVIYLLQKVELNKANKYKNIVLVAGAIIIFVGCFILVMGFMTSSTHPFFPNFGNFKHLLQSIGSRVLKVYVFFIFPSLLLLISIYQRTLRLTLVMSGILTILFMAVNMNLYNNSALHFVIAANWFTAFYFAGVHANFIFKKQFIFSGLILISSLLFLDPISKKLTNFDDIKTYQKKTDAKLYIDKLIELRESDKRFLIYIPESETEFWHHLGWNVSAPSSRYFMPFWIPMLSGKAAFNGFNHEFMEGAAVAWYKPGTYGYSSYYNQRNKFDKSTEVIRLKVQNGILSSEILQIKDLEKLD